MRIRENGRAEPWLAQEISRSADGLSVKIRLRKNSTFHDGSPVSAALIARILDTSLPQTLGPAFADVERITAIESDVVEIKLRRASLLLEEALDVAISKPDQPTISTGPFMQLAPGSQSELTANADYYLGPPGIQWVTLANYPTVRAAWADLLRDNVDMLYEVGSDAREFLEDATHASVLSFTRPYQYMVVLNVHSEKLRSSDLRHALNLAIDRAAVVRDAFDGHAMLSSGPVWPKLWAVGDEFPEIDFDPQAAARIVSARPGGSSSSSDKAFHFTCLVPPDYERVALVVKRQLEAIGVVMDLKEATSDEAVQALGTRTFDAVLLDLAGGFGMFRTYAIWHSAGSRNLGGLGSGPMDVALDRIRYAASEDEYRKAVIAFQQFAINDPPAIFLAWGERARAVSRRFDVAAEPGRDILTTLRLWRPADQRVAGRN